MPWVQDAACDAAWAEFDAKQAGAGVTRRQFEGYCSRYRSASTKKKRRDWRTRLAIGTNNWPTLLALIPATVADPDGVP